MSKAAAMAILTPFVLPLDRPRGGNVLSAIHTALGGGDQWTHYTGTPGWRDESPGVIGIAGAYPNHAHRDDDLRILKALFLELPQAVANPVTYPTSWFLPSSAVSSEFVTRLEIAAANPIYDTRHMACFALLAGRWQTRAPDGDYEPKTGSIYEPWKSYANGSWQAAGRPLWMGHGEQP